MVRIDTKRGRDSLQPRREPYWYKLTRGRYLGLRKVSISGGTWIARYRDDTGTQRYRALGEATKELEFDQAKSAAEVWIQESERGVSDRDADGDIVTVASCCRAYVESLRIEGRAGASHDAHMRFRRTIYGDSVDQEFGPKPRIQTESKREGPKPRKWPPVIHSIADIPVFKLRTPRLRSWHVDLVTKGLSKAAANRTLTALKAALNMAVSNRMVAAAAATEWTHVEPFKGAARRRELFLDVAQRRALLSHANGSVRRLIEATMYTGCRAGELTSARRSSFDARTRSLSVTGKTGSRTIPLMEAAIALFTELAKDKLPHAYLLTRDDGRPWGHSDWDEAVKSAAERAKLPAATCLYTLRHSFITQALLEGVSTLEVSRIVGTSLTMIEKHYGHLVYETARERLNKVQMV